MTVREKYFFGVNQQVRRTVIPFDKISPYIKSATISIEDEGFYRHNGIQISSIIRAVIVNILTQNYTQGSTITQQVIKNSFLPQTKPSHENSKNGFSLLNSKEMQIRILFLTYTLIRPHTEKH